MKLEEHLNEVEDGHQEAEARAKKFEALSTKLKADLDEKEKSVALLSRLAKERERDIYYANIKIMQLLDRVQGLESQLKDATVAVATTTTTTTTAEAPTLSIDTGVGIVTPAVETHSSVAEEPTPAPEHEPSHDSDVISDKKDLSRFVIARKGGKRRSVVMSPMEFVRLPPLQRGTFFVVVTFFFQ